MENNERAEKACEMKASGKFNCAQAVLAAFEDRLPVKGEALMQIGSGFASGMGGLQATCGALIGAVVASGFITKGSGNVRVANRMLKSFEKRCGATLCKDLKGLETGKALCECPMCVYNAVDVLCEELEI